MQVIALSEGSFTIDKTKIFVPFNQEQDDLQQRPVGSLLVEVQPFVVVGENDIILIDAGLGFSINGELQIYANLAAHGIQPHHITKVLVSHLHKDHAGGLTRKDYLGNYHLSFPNAVYYIQQKELEFAMDTGFPSYMSEEISALQNSSQVVLLNGDGIIDNFIEYKISGAHSPWHQVFWIENDKKKIFFGGDEAPQLQQMKTKFIAKYDFDGKKSMLFRQQWWQTGNEEDWMFLFYHDIKQPFWKISE